MKQMEISKLKFLIKRIIKESFDESDDIKITNYLYDDLDKHIYMKREVAEHLIDNHDYSKSDFYKLSGKEDYIQRYIDIIKYNNLRYELDISSYGDKDMQPLFSALNPFDN